VECDWRDAAVGHELVNEWCIEWHADDSGFVPGDDSGARQHERHNDEAVYAGGEFGADGYHAVTTERVASNELRSDADGKRRDGSLYVVSHERSASGGVIA
jgi:hypothetical protein